MNGLSVLLTLLLFLLANQLAIELRRAGVLPGETSAQDSGFGPQLELAKQSTHRPHNVSYR